ncbi:SRPBCC family protein [Actinoplanes sp. NPDC049596]|uniref:SRPBCC family protein n=1 Tax=unclassified Actinoplanes TaxID=2626549 RepID=UPI00342A61CA
MTLRRTLEAAGPRPPDDVWDRYIRPARWPEWSPQIRSVDYEAPLLQPGTHGTLHGPGGFPVTFRIGSVEPDTAVRRWSWTATALGIHLHLCHTVEAVPLGTRTVLALEGPAPAVLLYLPAARWALHRLVH